MTSNESWLVVGLRNPGPKYADTRHNVGAMVVEALAARVGASFKANRRRRADVAEARLGDQPGVRSVLALPHSYMNESGGPVAGLCAFYKIPAERLVVVHDEMDLPLGSVRLKRGGSDNGHNGLRSIRASLGTGDYHRVRFGVGRPPGRMDPPVYLLKRMSATERRDIDVEVERIADAVEALVVDGLTVAQNTYNS